MYSQIITPMTANPVKMINTVLGSLNQLPGLREPTENAAQQPTKNTAKPAIMMRNMRPIEARKVPTLASAVGSMPCADSHSKRQRYESKPA